MSSKKLLISIFTITVSLILNKSYWVSVWLDGTVEREKLEWLLNLSFDLTKKTNKSKEIKKESKTYLNKIYLAHNFLWNINK